MRTAATVAIAATGLFLSTGAFAQRSPRGFRATRIEAAMAGYDECRVTALSDKAYVAGTCAQSEGEEARAFRWVDGVMTNVGVLGGFNQGRGSAVNNYGDVVGVSELSFGPEAEAYLWSSGAMVGLASSSPGDAWFESDATGRGACIVVVRAMTALDDTFRTLSCEDHRFGVAATVALPDVHIAGDASWLERLEHLEAVHAQTLRAHRWIEWVGGRLAWHEAARRYGLSRSALATDVDRRPIGPAEVSVSVTHKRDRAVCLVGAAGHGDVGIDLEDIGEPRWAIADRVLCSEELDELRTLDDEARWREVITRFAIKEATYKAIFPTLRRYVGYREAVVVGTGAAARRVQLVARSGEPALELELEVVEERTRVLASVRCQRAR